MANGKSHIRQAAMRMLPKAGMSGAAATARQGN
jgi:hypothetical protein